MWVSGLAVPQPQRFGTAKRKYNHPSRRSRPGFPAPPSPFRVHTEATAECYIIDGIPKLPPWPKAAVPAPLPGSTICPRRGALGRGAARGGRCVTPANYGRPRKHPQNSPTN